MLENLITLVVYILVIAIIAGLLIYLVRRAPFLPEPFRPVIEWIILALAIIGVCYALLGLVRGGTSLRNIGALPTIERVV